MYKNVYKLRITCLAKAKEEFTDKIINIKKQLSRIQYFKYLWTINSLKVNIYEENNKKGKI